MWGYVASAASAEQRAATGSAGAMLEVARALARSERQPYLLSSTALSELALFV